MIVHHSRKSSNEKTVDDGRGASALLAAVRTARTLNPMTAKEADDVEIEERERRFYFRADIGKANLMRPAEHADWFKLVSVDLGNAAEGEDWHEGDHVGVVTSFDYPQLDRPKVTPVDILRAQAAIRAGGPWRADSRATKEPWIGVAIGGALNLDLTTKPGKRAVVALVKDWLKSGLLKTVQSRDEHREVHDYVEAGNPPVLGVAAVVEPRRANDPI